MSTTAAAIAKSRELADVLKLQVAATLPIVVETNDSNGDPVITLSADSTPATGEKVIVIRTKAIGAIGALDSLGNPAQNYSHHVIEVCTEKNYEGTTDSVLDILGPAELLPVLGECAQRGVYVRWYRSANGTVPATAQMTAANLACEWRNSLFWNVLSAG
jgi:hypothetical protein